MIPKKIHYCWFGRGDKPPLVKKCIATWYKYFPDYEIIEWNEDNFDVTKTNYMKEAYDCKKWAFVSDIARLMIIYEHGGIYFDTDVEVLKNFDHLLIDYGYFSFENTTNNPLEKPVNTGLGFATTPQNVVVGALIKEYENLHFLIDGEMDLTPCPIRNTEALRKMGLIANGEMQLIKDVIVYPYDYFCGYDMANSFPVRNPNTYTIHHYSATWKCENKLVKWIKYNVIIKGIQVMLGYETYKKLKEKIKKHKWL